jgi:predicted transcriptional regulator
VVSKEQYGQRSLKKLMNEYFSGAPDQLVSFLVQKKELTPEQLQSLLDQLENTSDEA